MQKINKSEKTYFVKRFPISVQSTLRDHNLLTANQVLSKIFPYLFWAQNVVTDYNDLCSAHTFSHIPDKTEKSARKT